VKINNNAQGMWSFSQFLKESQKKLYECKYNEKDTYIIQL